MNDQLSTISSQPPGRSVESERVKEDTAANQKSMCYPVLNNSEVRLRVEGVRGCGARASAASVMLAAILALTAGCDEQRAVEPAKAVPEVTFKAQDMADALHAVVAADREMYARHIVQRLGTEEKVLSVSEHWREDKALPVPMQMLRLGAETVQQKGAEFHYIVRSLWPLNPRNGAETATEKKGLQAVLEHPETNFYAEESLGGRRYFTAVYADTASVSSCVDCHNAHPSAGKRDFKVGDVMGGIIVRVPLEF